MKGKNLQDINENDPEWIIETVKELFNKDINSLSKNQKKMLQDQYFDYLEDGLQPKEAMEKALKIILCFNKQ